VLAACVVAVDGLCQVEGAPLMPVMFGCAIQGVAAVKQDWWSRHQRQSTVATASYLLPQAASISGPENTVTSSRRPKYVSTESLLANV